MTTSYIMSLDAGTTSVRAIIFDRSGKTFALSQKPIQQFYPQPGWVEQDGEEIFQSICDVMRDALKRSGLTAQELSAIGITNHGKPR